MSSTSSSRVQPRARVVAIARLGRSARLRRGERLGVPRPRSRHEDRAVRRVPGRDLVAPPELARDAPGLDVLEPVEVGLLPVLRARSWVSPSRTAAIAGSASGFASTYHWSVRHGSIDHARAVAVRDGVRRAARSSRASPRSSIIATMRLRASKRSRPCSARSPSRLGIASARPGTPRCRRASTLRLGVEDVDRRQLVPPADLEVVEVVRGRDLDRAGALLGIGVFVGDDRDAPADQRQDDVLADQIAGSARRPDGPRRRCRRASSRGAWSRR